MKKNNQRFILGLIADQSPGKFEEHYRTTFLNQETMVIIGPEKIASKTNDRVIFVQIQKIKRGYYKGIIQLVHDNPAQLQPNELTEMHLRMLEKMIIENPEYWLWSHNRWKYTR